MEWGVLVPTLVGGAISLVTSIVMFGAAQAFDRRQSKSEHRIAEIRSSYVGLQKLMKTANTVLSLKRDIDAEFESAKLDGDISKMEASAIVKPIIGARGHIEQLSADECPFLAGEKGAKLLSDIWVIERRAISNEVTIEKYNELKFDFIAFTEKSASELKGLASSKLELEFSEANASIAKMRIGAMNSVIGFLIAHLEKDAWQIKTVVERYVEQAVEKFGSDFPMQSIEWLEG